MLNDYKLELQINQKKGLPFTLAAVIVWIFVTFISSLNVSIDFKNLLTFIASASMFPIALIFGKVLKVSIAQKLNPLTKLGLYMTFNQFLYLLIVMLLMNQHPQLMLLSYAIVYAAHLFPYGWIYDSKIYTFGSGLLAISSIFVFFIGNSFLLACYNALFMICFNILLWREVKQ